MQPVNKEINPREIEDRIQDLGGSGFPFQSRVASEIRKLSMFKVEEEVAWTDDDGSTGFIDIVASNDNVCICIECKAFKGTRLTFLAPDDTRVFSSNRMEALVITREWLGADVPVVKHGLCAGGPETPESQYCVVGGQKGESRLIEREIQPLIRGVERLAIDRVGLLGKSTPTVCVPMFCTTATLATASYDPEDVSLEDSVFRAKKDHIELLPSIRLTKQFTACNPCEARLRTVLITQAAELSQVMRRMKVFAPPGPEAAVTFFHSLIPFKK